VPVETRDVARVHGGIDIEELECARVDPNDLVDFSSSVNPYGPSPEVVRAIREAPFDRYPDPTASRLRRALAGAYDTAPDRIVVGNGAADLLWTLARVLVRPGDPVVIAEPTFAEFRAAASFAGARVIERRAKETDGFAIDVEAIERTTRDANARVVYLCSPGTPTGSYVPLERVADFARRNPIATLILDQAFLSLSEHAAEERLAVPPNVVRVRSLTKDHALAGVRLGYFVATPDLARRAEGARPPWTTSSLAQAAGLAAIDARGFVEAIRQKLLADRDELVVRLGTLGIETVPSCACFFVFPTRDAAALRARLLRRSILVRDCTSFGMPAHVRVAARPAADRERLLEALRREIASC
jgi:histidinol-phosphate aminotransferase